MMVARKRSAEPEERDDVLPVIPWYWQDWRASTARAVFANDRDAGWCFRELLDAMWGWPDAALPDEDAVLAALAGVTLADWRACKRRVLRFIPLDARGRRYHPRVRKEWLKATANRARFRAGGRARAMDMWGSPAFRGAIAALQAGCSTPTPSPSPSAGGREEKDSGGGAVRIAASLGGVHADARLQLRQQTRLREVEQFLATTKPSDPLRKEGIQIRDRLRAELGIVEGQQPDGGR